MRISGKTLDTFSLCYQLMMLVTGMNILEHLQNGKKVLEFVDWMMSMTARYKNINYNILQTVSTYNVYYIPEFYDFFKDKVPLVGHPLEDSSLHISHNFVNDPEHFDCRILPKEVQDVIVKRLEGYQGYNDIKNYLSVDGESRWGGCSREYENLF